MERSIEKQIKRERDHSASTHTHTHITIPVSYTHLDVYKRQVLTRRRLSIGIATARVCAVDCRQRPHSIPFASQTKQLRESKRQSSRLQACLHVRELVSRLTTNASLRKSLFSLARGITSGSVGRGPVIRPIRQHIIGSPDDLSLIHIQMCIRDRVKEYLTTSIISSIRSKPAEHYVNDTEVKENGIVAYKSGYIKIEELQYLLIKKDLNMTENRDLNEDFASAKLQYQMHESCLLYTSRCV